MSRQYHDKQTTCSCCMICISCSVHLISMYYTCAKDPRLFILITHKSTRLENPIAWIEIDNGKEQELREKRNLLMLVSYPVPPTLQQFCQMNRMLRLGQTQDGPTRLSTLSLSESAKKTKQNATKCTSIILSNSRGVDAYMQM